MLPSVSVIIPARNAQAYIHQALASVLSQTLVDFELIVIDNGSYDKTSQIVSSYALDARVRSLTCVEGGLVGALNYGLSVAAAGLVARMDADDIMMPDRLQKQYDYMRAHHDVVALGTQVEYMDDRGNIIDRASRFPETGAQINKTLLKYCCLCHPTVMMRKDVIQSIGGYRAAFPAAEDFDLWLRLIEKFEIANLPDVLLRYRVHAGQVSKEKVWTQRLSRNLALLSAKSRRETGADPLNGFSYRLIDPAPTPDDKISRRKVYETCRAFKAAERIITKNEIISVSEANRLLAYLSKHTIGDGQKTRLKLLIKLYGMACRLNAPILALKAFAMAFMTNPSRTLRWLVTGVPQGDTADQPRDLGSSCVVVDPPPI